MLLLTVFYHSSRNQTRTPGEGLFIDPWVTLGWLPQCELFQPSVVADSQSSIFSLLCPTCRQLQPQGAPLPSNLFNCLNDLREGAHGTCNFLSFFLFICFYYLLFHFLIQKFFIDEKFYFCPHTHHRVVVPSKPRGGHQISQELELKGGAGN